MDIERTVLSIEDQLKRYIQNRNAVIGISGGIDSAVVAALCTRALGKNRVVAVQMPYGEQSTEDGTILIEHLGLENGITNIKPIVDSFTANLGELINNEPLTNGNIRARTRMTILYALAGSCNGLVVGTSNKTEIMLGYFTKYGDGGCDIEPIGGSTYKTEVFKLAEWLNIPSSIITKKPSAELWAGQTDEGK